MKLPFKYIAILVIVSLAGIFAYQAYWLTGLYHTMHSEMERDITEAMRMSDYNEMMIRVDKMKQDDINHGEEKVAYHLMHVNFRVKVIRSLICSRILLQRVRLYKDNIEVLKESSR